MKNSFEIISDQEINNASELELSDQTGREAEERRKQGDKYQKEIKDELVELFEDNYFSAMNRIDELSVNIDDDELKERFGFDMKKLRYYIDYALPELLGRINSLAKENKLRIVSHNSLRDVLSNSIFSGIANIGWFREHINDGNELNRKKIENPNSGRRVVLKNFSELLNSEDLKYYVRELCRGDEKVLAMEVGEEYGFLSKFAEYFNENKYGKIFPSGSAKFPYFRFFNEAEKWKRGEKSEINEENFRMRLEKLDDKFVNKDKIIRHYLKYE